MPYPERYSKKELKEKYERHRVCEKCGKTFPHINAKLQHLKEVHGES